jgi:hypothetical protein
MTRGDLHLGSLRGSVVPFAYGSCIRRPLLPRPLKDGTGASKGRLSVSSSTRAGLRPPILGASQVVRGI